MAIRIQRKRLKGWKAPMGAINCTRPSKYGNPFSVEKYGLENSLMLYEKLLTEAVSVYELPFDAQEDAFNSPIIYAYDISQAHSLIDMIKQELGGKDLMCFCPLDQKCHVDILLKIANN